MRNLVLLLFITLCFTSCFEITEEVSMNKDGSGNVVLTLNMSESKDNIKSYMSMDEYRGQAIPKQPEIEMQLERVQTILKGVEGLSEVQSDYNFNDYIFSFSGNFTDVEVLNQVVHTFTDEAAKSSRRTIDPKMKMDNFKQTNTQFERLFDYPVDASIYDKLGTMERFLLESARVVGIYRFPNKVRKVSNPNAELSPSGKAVLFKSNLAALAKGKVSLANTISF